MSNETDISLFRKDIKDLKSRLRVIPSFSQSTYLVALIIDKHGDNNNITQISCERGLPIGGYVYDSVTDCYKVTCVDYLALGYIPVSFRAEMDHSDSWGAPIPMPENIINRYLSQQQKIDLRLFKSKYKTGQYDLQYLQMVGSV